MNNRPRSLTIACLAIVDAIALIWLANSIASIL